MGSSEGGLTRLPERVGLEEVERPIASLVGIEACRVVANDWGALEEVHVLIGPDRHPKQAVRDIESALAARWKLRVDHKKISVAQIGAASAADEPTPAHTRHGAPFVLEMLRTSNRLDEGCLEVSVILASGGSGARGEGQASSRAPHRYNLNPFAEATLMAADQLMDGDIPLALENIEILRMSQCEVIVCLLSPAAMPASDIGCYVGAAVIREGDRGRTAVSATLAAIEHGLRDGWDVSHDGSGS